MEVDVQAGCAATYGRRCTTSMCRYILKMMYKQDVQLNMEDEVHADCAATYKRQYKGQARLHIKNDIKVGRGYI
jgi:hypothetical protein